MNTSKWFVIAVLLSGLALAGCLNPADKVSWRNPPSVTPVIQEVSPVLPTATPGFPEISADSSGSQNSVVFTKNGLNTKKLDVKAGDVVIFINDDDSAQHVLSFGDGEEQVLLEPRGVFTKTFDEPGTYAFKCILHDGEEGTVEVT
ncbi:cupredoxin domain-containing protein [Candidatus Micrarchaeota archaeon]|nr:cupredoxin domain-containing protein [Candidatus Micrarchaeota archaeon]